MALALIRGGILANEWTKCLLWMKRRTGQAEKSIHWDAENKPIDEGEMVKFLSFNICAE